MTMPAKVGGGISISSSEVHNYYKSITTPLASAFLEWLLMILLFIDAAFSYVITKFASFCNLQNPCLFCSRLDHVLGKEKKGYYWDLICTSHKSHISSLVLCPAHNKLVNVQGLCETCLFSFTNIDKSNTEIYPLLVSKLGQESGSRFDEDPLLGAEHLIPTTATRCSCCNEQNVLRGFGQRLVLAKSNESEGADFDELDAVGNNFHDKKRRRSKQSVSFKDAHLRNNQLDPLSHVGYTELKISSDTESEAPLSDADDNTSIPVRATDDAKEEIKVIHELMEPCSTASLLEPSSESGVQLENTDSHDTKSEAAKMECGNGLEDLQCKQVERNDVCPSPNEPISSNNVPVQVSKENNDLAVDEVRLTSEKRSTDYDEEIIKSSNKVTTSDQQNPNSLDLGDAYKLAVSNRGRQLSGMLVEHWLGKDSRRMSEDLKTLSSQLSARAMDLISPRLSINGDDVKTCDVSNSAGMQIFQKMISLERNESGLSLDGSIVSEIEGEGAVDRLKRQVEHDRKLMSALYKELEEERNASAVAASQALAMITRLQEEKATLHMEALQYLRMMDEESEYETGALQKLNDLVSEKEKEIEYLEAKLDFYRKKYHGESALENMVDTDSEVRVKDLGLDHSQCTSTEKDESVLGKSVTEDLKNVQSVRSSSSELEDERLYISQRLKKLEKQVYFFLNIHQSEDSCLNSASPPKLNSDAVDDDPSSKKPPVCKENSEVEYDGHSNDFASSESVVSDMIGRLKVVEADQSFLEHTMKLLRNVEGIKVLQEIADHLQQLRRIGIPEIDQPVA
ncbi:hypothetical protein TanjilG_24960 [Lupinus angustifolius]|uniref:GTD-binding domain-containing protein n=2 Tax=Lupinus angustifolius TaxID=3871 RepID=A0A394DC19_LUPAN|nr:PREDICTED: myosin-binding protein 1-like isoform X2 [Lupinus angustifolius]OIW20882.1 hypothetical protein TanjilG_24960 [Lupinus angustifolius]